MYCQVKLLLTMLYCFQNVPAVMMGYLRFKTLHGLWGVGYRTEGGACTGKVSIGYSTDQYSPYCT